jgi:hypothetical protein
LGPDFVLINETIRTIGWQLAKEVLTMSAARFLLLVSAAVLALAVTSTVLAAGFQETADSASPLMVVNHDAAFAVSASPPITTTFTYTTSPGAQKITKAILYFFTNTFEISPTLTLTDVVTLRQSNLGWGEVFKVLYFAQTAITSTDSILAMRESGMGWGEIARELDLNLKGKRPNLGSAVSGRSSVTPTPAPTTAELVRERLRARFGRKSPPGRNK